MWRFAVGGAVGAVGVVAGTFWVLGELLESALAGADDDENEFEDSASPIPPLAQKA